MEGLCHVATAPDTVVAVAIQAELYTHKTVGNLSDVELDERVIQVPPAPCLDLGIGPPRLSRNRITDVCIHPGDLIQANSGASSKGDARPRPHPKNADKNCALKCQSR